MTEPHTLFTARNLTLLVSLAAMLVIYFVHSRWTTLAVPVVWISAYSFGWYEGREPSDG